MQQDVHHQLLLCCANRTCCSLLRQLYELPAAQLVQQVTLCTDLGLLVHDLPQNVSHSSSMGHIRPLLGTSWACWCTVLYCWERLKAKGQREAQQRNLQEGDSLLRK